MKKLLGISFLLYVISTMIFIALNHDSVHLMINHMIKIDPDQTIKPYLNEDYTEDYLEIAGILSPPEIKDEIIHVVSEFSKTFERICDVWSVQDDGFFQDLENCKNLPVCRVSKQLDELVLLFWNKENLAFQHVQSFFDEISDAKNSHIELARFLHLYDTALFFSHRHEKGFDMRQIPRLEKENKFLVPGLLYNIVNMTGPYLNCHNDLKKYDKRLEKVVNGLQKDVAKSLMKLTILLCMNNKRMKVLNSFFVMVVNQNVLNWVIMLIFYFCPVIPFGITFAFQVFVLMVSKRVFGVDLEKKWKPWTIQVIKNANNSEQEQSEEQDQEQQRKIRSALQAVKNKKLKNSKTFYGPLKALIILGFSSFCLCEFMEFTVMYKIHI